MSSGFGIRGGTSRCFPEWQNFLICYTASTTTSPKQCKPNLDDYFECLHHTKERQRLSIVKAHLMANKQSSGQSFLPPAQTEVQPIGLVE